MPDTHQAYDIFFEKQGFTKVLMYLLESQMGTNVYRMDKHCTRTPSTVCGRSTRSARPRGLGGDFEFLPLKSPRNPITPIETSRVATLHPGLYKRLREDARRVIGATAKPLYAIDGKAEGLDRRSPPRPPSSREGDRPQAVEGVRSGGRSSSPHALNGVRARRPLEKTFFKLHMLHMHHMPNTYQAYDVFFSFF